MTKIIPFPKLQKAPRDVLRPHSTGLILMFTGVRYERLGDETRVGNGKGNPRKPRRRA